jgi:hypothetical protein
MKYKLDKRYNYREGDYLMLNKKTGTLKKWNKIGRAFAVISGINEKIKIMINMNEEIVI